MRHASRLTAAVILAITALAGVGTAAATPGKSDPRGAFRVADTPLPPAGPDDPVVSLTFDDGPSPEYTPQILAILRQFNVKATFFELGGNAMKHPEVTRQVLAEGHVVANHTYNHPRLPALNEDQFAAEVDRTQTALESITGVRPDCLRPPYGASDPTVVERLHARSLTPVFWTADSTDFDKPGVDLIVQRALLRLGKGSIILMHDGGGNRTQTIAALPRIIQGIQAAGYRIAPICQPDVHIPKGSVEVVKGLRGQLQVSGWIVDPDVPDPIDAQIYVDGAMALPLKASKPRPDLTSAGLTPDHGFDVTFYAPEGHHEVCVTGVNLAAGSSNPSIGCLAADVISPVPFSIKEAVNRIRWIHSVENLIAADPPRRVREAYALFWRTKLYAAPAAS